MEGDILSQIEYSKGKSEIVYLETLLNDELRMPEYQRPYRWGKDLALKFFEDTYTAFINDKAEYRLGTVILCNSEKENMYYIVDGLQRMTTLSIVFYIFNELMEESIENIDDNESNTLNYGLINEGYDELSCASIRNNYLVLREKIYSVFSFGKIKNSGEKEDNLNDKSRKITLENYRRYLLENCTFVKVVIDNEDEAFQFFDSQNSRGKGLAPHDLLKAYHLREMENDLDIIEKKEIIKTWEDRDEYVLREFFSEHMYPILMWYRYKNGLNYSTKDIKIFKGVKKSKAERYNYFNYNYSANLYIEKQFTYSNNLGMGEENKIASTNLIIIEGCENEPMYQFQLTQPIIAGKRFFKYCSQYLAIFDKVEEYVKNYFEVEYESKIMRRRRGDVYVYNMFINALVFFVDKFNFAELNTQRLRILYRWAYSLRIKRRAVKKVAVNKYALGNLADLNSGINIFNMIHEMQEPVELEMIILDGISEDEISNSDREKYKGIIEELKNNKTRW